MKNMKNRRSKKLLVVFFACLIGALACPFSSQAQDLLVTTQRDTLNAKIGDLTDDHYLIKFIDEDHLVTGKIHKDSVLFYKKNVFRSISNNRLRPWYPRISYGIDFGVSHQYGPLQVGLEKEERQLNPEIPYEYIPIKGSFSDRNALYIAGDIVFYLSPMVGYGVKYNYRRLLDGDLNYSYVAPMVVLRFWDKKRENHFFTNLSIGYGRMTHKNTLITIPYDSKAYEVDILARTLAGDIGVGYDMRLSQYISARFKLSTTIGYPENVRVPDYPKPNTGGQNPAPIIGRYCDNMNTINLSVGFTFNQR